METSAPKIKVMSGVATALFQYGDRRLVRAAGIFYALKSMFRDGVIRNPSEKTEWLAGLCYMSAGTFRTNVAYLERKGLLSRRNGKIYLKKYKVLHELIDARICNKDHYRRLSCRPDYIIRQLLIHEQHQRQEHMIKKKLELHRTLGGNVPKDFAEAREAELSRMIAHFRLSKLPALVAEINNRKLAKDKLTALELNDYSNQMRSYPASFICNPDIAMSQAKLALHFGCASKSAGYYWQKKLAALKLIFVQPRRVESPARCRWSPLGYVDYDRASKQTFMVMRNQVQIL